MVYCSHSARYTLLPGHCLLCISALLWCCCRAKGHPPSPGTVSSVLTSQTYSHACGRVEEANEHSLFKHNLKSSNKGVFDGMKYWERK